MVLDSVHDINSYNKWKSKFAYACSVIFPSLYLCAKIIKVNVSKPKCALKQNNTITDWDRLDLTDSVDMCYVQ